MPNYPDWVDTPEERAKWDATNKKSTGFGTEIARGIASLMGIKERYEGIDRISADDPGPPTTTTSLPEARPGEPRTTIRKTVEENRKKRGR